MNRAIRRQSLGASERYMILTAYCLAHGHWTVIPHQLQQSFADMADCGFTAVALSFSESEMRYSRRAFELQVDLAHRCGLKVFVIPSRVGNRFAGAPLMCSPWLLQHPEAQIPGYLGWNGPVACLESTVFRDWIKQFMATLLGDYPLDGIIWDEPKAEAVVSHHPETLARFGPAPTSQQMEDGFVDFLADLTGHCLSLRPNLVVTLFNQAKSSPRFTSAMTAIAGVHYAGYDGNLCAMSAFHEPPTHSEEKKLEEVWPRTQQECAAAGKGTFALVENMLMPRQAMGEYEANLDAYLSAHRPDHLSLYYYAHNNEDPHAVHQVTRRLMQRHLPSLRAAARPASVTDR
jgi:hypothetical protein